MLDTLALSPADWIAVASIALPLIAKTMTDVAAYLETRRHNALARIVGMAGREAAEIARTLATLPPNKPGAQIESALITDAAGRVLNEMARSAQLTDATTTKVASIIQQEVSRLVVVSPDPALPPAPVP